MFVITLIVILLSIAIHEFAHAWVADAAGDPTPRMMGRVTLNPLKHLDPIGTIMIIFSSLAGFGIGWGKPVMVNPSKMRNPRWDHFMSVAAGPVSNLIQAGIYAVVLRLAGSHISESMPLFWNFLFFGVVVNVSLALFNLVPIGPLDGHWMVGTFLPPATRLQWYRFNQGPGSLIFLVLVLIPNSPISSMLRPFTLRIVEFLIGIK